MVHCRMQAGQAAQQHDLNVTDHRAEALFHGLYLVLLMFLEMVILEAI